MAFRIKLKKSVGESIAEAERAGVSLTKDGGLWRMEISSPLGKVKGTCREISGNDIEVTITGKPFVVSEGMIKGKIEEYLC
ncbi:MAG: hypothetical protein FWB85_08755 [Chitinispirillia bacterium]|nr:hypothetical protein [Chitinispirillia bacterium]